MRFFYLLFVLLAANACGRDNKPLPQAKIVSVTVDDRQVQTGGSLTEVSLTPRIVVEFSQNISLDEESLSSLVFTGGALSGSLAGAKTLVLTPVEKLFATTKYRLVIPTGACFGVNLAQEFRCSLTTSFDTSDKFPRISDADLLTKVQQQTFKYFWDYAHPVSGLARERLGSGDTVTSGGSGFGIMCLPVGVERGFITRAEAATRLRTILDFLSKADRFHGAFPHWLNGSSGKVIPFSDKDNGGDLVETSFLIQALLTVEQYFDRDEEADIRSAIQAIWQAVEWDWYTRGGQQVLYWHWSPQAGWAMNMTIVGWNEALITYVLAASSPTHPISADAYHQGWGRNRSMKPTVSGPLFFTHYSFLGLDPRNLADVYANYWDHNRAHAQYNNSYCIKNTQRHAGYSADSWGLTACDTPHGYEACSPANDKGTIAPTAALSSMPYTPQESMRALRYFYYVLGDKLWGDYGFRDAFSLDESWVASSYIAIDQGPIVVMIENHRSGLLWNLFMKNTDVQRGLKKLGFEENKKF